MSKILDLLTSARRASVPLLAISTTDPWALAKAIGVQESKGWMSGPRFTWDVVRGLSALTDDAKPILKRLVAEDSAFAETSNPVSMLEAISKLPGSAGAETPGGSMVLAFNLHAFIQGLQANPQVIQAVSNLREQFKRNRRTLVILSPEVRLPAELVNDLVVLDEELPGDEQIRAKLLMLYDVVKMAHPDEAFIAKAIDAVRGLSIFAIEQVYAMSMNKGGLDLAQAWQRKEETIKQTPGLSISRGKLSFDDLGGLKAMKARFGRKMLGRKPPRVVVFVDEIDKALGGVGGDLSGVSDDAYSVVLQWIEDYEHAAAMLVGPGGTAKTAFAQALAKTFGVPMLRFDMGAMQAGIVGESQRNIRRAVKVANGVAGDGGALIIATCNEMKKIPMPLRRRMTAGIYYCDIPTTEELPDIWKLNLQRYGLALDSALPPCEEWTGAEVRNCCRTAWEDNVSLMEAAESIVPVAKSDPRGLAQLREMADGAFLSASYPGPYHKGVTAEDMPERATMIAVAEVELPKSAGKKENSN